MRYNWIGVRLDAIDHEELRELIVDGWRMCVPKSVAASIGDESAMAWIRNCSFAVDAGVR